MERRVDLVSKGMSREITPDIGKADPLDSRAKILQNRSSPLVCFRNEWQQKNTAMTSGLYAAASCPLWR